MYIRVINICLIASVATDENLAIYCALNFCNNHFTKYLDVTKKTTNYVKKKNELQQETDKNLLHFTSIVSMIFKNLNASYCKQ